MTTTNETVRLEIWLAGPKATLEDAREATRHEAGIAVDFWQSGNRMSRYDVCVHTEGDREYILAHWRRVTEFFAPFKYEYAGLSFREGSHALFSEVEQAIEEVPTTPAVAKPAAKPIPESASATGRVTGNE